MSQFIIPDSQAQGAFDILRSTDHAIKRAAFEMSEKRLKVVLARAAAESNAKTVSERDNAALCSQSYTEALEQLEAVSEAYYIAKDRRDAASACLDAWRTQQSDRRSMAKVG